MKNTTIRSLFLGGALSLLSSLAYANSITLTFVSAVPSGTGSDWSYAVNFSNSSVKSTDFFTINDFGTATLVGTFTNPGGTPVGTWALSQAAVGPNALATTDNAAVLNATMTYTGATGVVNTTGEGTATLVLHSPLANTVPALSSYTSLDQAAFGSGIAGNDSRVVGPIAVPNVPDGGVTIALLGGVLVGLAALRRRIAS